MASQKTAGVEYKVLSIRDEENNLSRSDGDNSPRNRSYGLRIASRVGVTLAVVALVGAGVKITQGRTDIGKSHPAQATEVQENVVGFSAPCGTVAPVASICPSNGQLFQPSKSCCLSTCGAHCGAIDCQKAPSGYQNCCTSTFTKLCGSPGVVAPCKLPRTLAGAVQLVVNNLGNIQSNSAAAQAAVVAALSQLLGVPANDITAAIQTATSGGRRLNGAVNVDYVIRVSPSNADLTAQTIVAKSDDLKPMLQSQMAAKGITTTLESCSLPVPATQEPGVVAPQVVQTTPFPLLTFTKTQTWSGRIVITTNAVMAVLDNLESRTALATALAKVLDAPVEKVQVLGLGHESLDKVDAGYKVDLPLSAVAEDISSKAAALQPALQAAYNNAGIKAAVHGTTIGTPLLAGIQAPVEV